jgi:signal transduction histidine kinase
VQLCGATFGAVYRHDGELIHLAAHCNFSAAALAALEAAFPARAGDTSLVGRAIVRRALIHIADLEQAPDVPSTSREFGRRIGNRNILVVPMVREGAPIGAVVVGRAEPGLYTDKQVSLLGTFADQAVIAIENVRLFQELQTRTRELARSVGELRALGEIGQAVSSTLDPETVLTTIVANADQLSGTDGGAVYEYEEGTGQLHLRATRKFDEELVAVLRTTPPLLGEGAVGQAAALRQPVQIPDLTVEGAYHGPLRTILPRAGFRAVLAVPLVREGRVLGGLVVARKSPGAFPPETVELLKTFAAQSALAIQNARLFRELESASRHKSEFLANMSHELRTPLNAVIGFSEVLQERMFGELNDKQMEYVQDIHASGRHLLSLINDILDLSKVEAGRMELELAPFSIPAALENALILVRERAERHGLRLNLSVDGGLGELVADERKVKQVLLNLLANAVKFTPEGGRVAVSAQPADGFVEVAVTDTGIGIAPEDQEAIFEEFRQVGTDYARKREGTGLGLTLARKLVELHGGRMWVKSALGQGSTFTFTLPVRPWPAS